MSTEQNKLNITTGFSAGTNLNPLYAGGKEEAGGPASHFTEDSFTLNNQFALKDNNSIEKGKQCLDKIYYDGWDRLV